MRKHLKIWSILLTVFMLAGTVIPVHAEEINVPLEEEGTIDDAQVDADDSVSEIEGSVDDSSDETEGSADESIDETESTLDKMSGEVAGEESAGEPEINIEQRLNYVYVESPYLETPETQRIVVSWGDGTEGIEQFILKVRGDDAEEEWTLTRAVDNLYLFEKDFLTDEQSGSYQVTELDVTESGVTETFLMSDLEMEAYFGVNEEYSGFEELRPLEDEMAGEGAIEATVAMIGSNGEAEIKEDISEALREAEEDVKASTPSTIAMNDGIATIANNSPIVVALDPGHDATHAGAQGSGLREEDLTLKIANYCKEELEKYAGVKVYMTRTGAACPYPGGSTGADIKQRAYAAAKAGAKIYVSFHLNSAGSSASGAEIIIPNSSWKPSVSTEGKKLAEEIMDELVRLGLRRRSIYSKDTSVGERYDDGSLSDYFAVQIYNKQNGVPGIIVEHAFLTNSGDANNFLRSEAGLRSLGVADATGIAEYLGLVKTGARVSVTEGTYVLQSALAEGKVATVASTSMEDAAAITLNGNEKLSSQRFEVSNAGNGYYYIVAENSGKAITVTGGSASAGVALQQKPLNYTKDQQWAFISAGNGYYYLMSALGTYMDVKSAGTADGTPIQTYTLNQSDAQKWSLIESDYRPIEDGTYTFENGASGKVIDVDKGLMDNYANVLLADYNDTSSQRYEVRYVGSGYYKMEVEKSGKVLDVASGSISEGANLNQYEWNGTDAQLWKFIDAGNGQYYIRSKCGTVIAPVSDNAVSGTNICMKVMKDKEEQKWKLKVTDYRPVADGEYVIVNSIAKYLAVTEKGGNIQTWAYDDSYNQKFTIKYVGSGYYSILLSKTGKALDVVGASALPRTNVQMYTANNSDAQLWKFIDAGDGSYYIKSKLGTALDIYGGTLSPNTNIQVYTMNGTNAQKWLLDSKMAQEPSNPIEDGTYTIQNGSNRNQVLDITGASESNGGNAQTYEANDTSAQRFEITYVKDGYYRIVAEHSNRALDVKGGSVFAGANVQQYEWNGTDAQLWKFIDAGNGQYYILSKTGNVLDLNGRGAASRINVQTGIISDKMTQKWTLIRSSYCPVSDGTYSFRIKDTKNYVLEISGASKEDKANARLSTYSGTEAQQFEITHKGDGYYIISAMHSGKVLEYTGGATSGANVCQNALKNSENQLWKFINTDYGYYIKSKSGYVLDVTGGLYTQGTNVQLYSMNGTGAQKWSLRKEEDYETVDIAEGIYTIQSALTGKLMLDISSASKADGANVQIYTANGTDAQRFEVIKASGGYYKIISLASGKALDIHNAYMVSSINVQQYTEHGTAAQLWRFIEADSGQYYIQSKLGTALDVTGGLAVSGTNVQAYEMNKTDAQKWRLNPQEDLYRIMGKSDITAAQMSKFYRDRATVPYPYSGNSVAPSIEEFCQIYIEECTDEGVKADVAFCQAMLETGYLKFNGDVKANQYNFAGLGATGGGVPGHSFSDIRQGIRAQVQHLKAYASTEALNNECVDPRFSYVERGCAECVQWLGGKWATGKDYGYNIMRLINQLKAY